MWISRKKFEELTAQLESAHKKLEESEKYPVLFDIERKDRLNRFIFVRSGKIVVIETMGLISDAIGEWKEKLLG